MKLAPSILSFPPDNFRDPVRQLHGAQVDWIHLDVMDGQFVPPITFGADLAAAIGKLGAVPMEVHLMTKSPEAHFDAFIEAGCQRVIFHAEATAHAHFHCAALRKRGVQSGVAINPATPVEAILAVLDAIDVALVMTVNPGWGGQAFIASCLDKVRKIRSVAPSLDIEVDGGIDPNTIKLARDAGANVFVSGSYLAKATNIQQGVQELRAACG